MKHQPKSKRGRPPKYCPQIVKIICEAIADGVPYRYAAALAGVSYQTFCVWQRLFSEFSDAIEEAKAKGIQSRLKRLDKCANKGNPKSDIWYLERTVPEFSPSASTAESPLTDNSASASPSDDEVKSFLDWLTADMEFAKAVRDYIELKEQHLAENVVLEKLRAGVPIEEIELPGERKQKD
jgi:hypothetical protein